MPNGSDRVTSHPLQELQPTKTIDDPEIKAWLALGTKTKKKGGGKKKKGRLGIDYVAFVLSCCFSIHAYFCSIMSLLYLFFFLFYHIFSEMHGICI
jgi:hypothetical protein